MSSPNAGRNTPPKIPQLLELFVKIHSLPIQIILIALAATALAGCATRPATLKAAYQHDFLVGVAVNEKQFADQDQRGGPIIKAQFDSISPENALKWASVHPAPGVYDFTNADRYVAFGESNHLVIIGHTGSSADPESILETMMKPSPSRGSSAIPTTIQNRLSLPPARRR